MSECAECGGVGLVRVETAEGPASRPCGCQEQARIEARLKRAGIPPSFQHATRANFKVQPHTRKAMATAARFIEEFVPGLRSARSLGLLLTGSVGTGKTHLAVGVLRELIETKGVEGCFADMRELLDRLRASYGEDAGESQRQILKPLFAAGLVAIDELGAARPSDWAFETLELVIGGLYNRAIPCIVTTNLPNLAAGANTAAGGNEYARAARAETLGDRVGMRMWSRLQEMCVSVDMSGPDWRGRR